MSKTENACIRECANVSLINRSIQQVDDLSGQLNLTANILNLMGNTTRLKILYLIKTEIKICVCDLSDILEISVSAISQQLKRLKESNLLMSKKEGQIIYYNVHPKSMNIIDSIFEIFKLEITQTEAEYEK